MRSMRILITIASVALFATGCASSGSAANTASAANATGGSHYLVTEQELAGLADRSAYEALRQIRPTFLHSHATQSARNPVPAPVDVYIDGSKTEGLDALKRVRASTVKEIRFYEPQDANTRFGTGHNGGLIAVTLK